MMIKYKHIEILVNEHGFRLVAYPKMFFSTLEELVTYLNAKRLS